MAHVTYDADADVLYVQLMEANIARQTFLDDTRILDHSVDCGVVGIEFVNASEGVDLKDVPFAQRIEALIGGSGPSFMAFA